jgi:hypothetical protein
MHRINQSNNAGTDVIARMEAIYLEWKYRKET